jgi:4-diphosphocytidyl-2-C-methyl-D-erythritol kinase
MLRETAFAKVNLVLQVGRKRRGGLHELCSLVASIDLADDLVIEDPDGAGDRVVCAGVEGPNLASAALAVFRSQVEATLPPLAITITKRVPVAAGLGGGSADAAAVLRAANRLADHPLDVDELRELAAAVGSDVPCLVESRHALVTGTGDEIEPLGLPPMALVLVPQSEGLRTAEVYAEADRLGATRRDLDPGALRRLAGAPLDELAAALENDLERAARSLRPALTDQLAALRDAGALGATVTGSGPTVFGLFSDEAGAERAAGQIEGAIVATARSPA